jgi:hypothetical protein
MTNRTINIIEPYKGNYYDDYVHLLPKLPIIGVGEKKYSKIYQHVAELEEAKMKEQAHQRDNKSHFKRHLTGILGEAAMENYLRIPIIDYTISHSKNHKHADLKQHGIDVGIKTIEYSKLPLIEIGSTRPEIILIKEQTRPVFYICGVYHPGVLNKYSDEGLIWDDNIQGKTCFYAIDKGRPFKTLEDLKNIIGSKYIL